MGAPQETQKSAVIANFIGMENTTILVIIRNMPLSACDAPMYMRTRMKRLTLKAREKTEFFVDET